jgi:hypothetical protein
VTRFFSDRSGFSGIAQSPSAASTVNLQMSEPVASVQTAKREDVMRDRKMQAALRNTEYALRRRISFPNDRGMKNQR